MVSDDDKNILHSKEDAIAQGKHSMRRKQKERYIRKKRKKLKRIKAFLRFLLFILLIFVAYILIVAPQWYLKSDVFSTPDGKTVEIINNYIVPKNIIYDKLKNVKVEKKPIFITGVRNIKRELFKIPVIKNIYVRRYGFPARIQIIIRERIPAVIVKTNLKSRPIAFITTDGILVTNPNYMAMADSKSALTILTKSAAVVKDWDVKKLEYINKIVKTIEAYSSEKVEYIDMRNPNDIYVKIESTNIRLGVLDSLVFERIKRIYTILPKINEVDGEVKYVDLSWDKVNYFKLQKKDNNKPTQSIEE